VPIAGCRVIAHAAPPEETFFRAFRHEEFDVAELSFSTYLITTARGECPYVAIPAFVSRSFRHNSIYVRKGSGINDPTKLRGKRVGVPEYQVTAAVWVRAMLEQDYDVAAREISWVTGGVEEPGRHEKVSLDLPADIDISPAPPGRTLSEMLVEGEIDALTCPRIPAAFRNQDGGIERLFPDSISASREYYRRHGIFPIMHVIGIKKSIASRHPWLPTSVFKAFCQARDTAVNVLYDSTALTVTLPWLLEELEHTWSVMSQDYWPYGIEGNRKPLVACTRFRRHRVRCFNGTGGWSWSDDSLRESSSLKRCA
jgi:4,5-dihydroxyphthalate decarboxylase